MATVYGKLVDGNLVYAPASVTIEHTRFIPPPAEWMQENGYLEMVYTSVPDTTVGQCPVSRWEEQDVEGVRKLVRVWSVESVSDNQEPTIDAMVAEHDDFIRALIGVFGGDE